jgi:hypothetical protein
VRPGAAYFRDLVRLLTRCNGGEPGPDRFDEWPSLFGENVVPVEALLELGTGHSEGPVTFDDLEEPACTVEREGRDPITYPVLPSAMPGPNPRSVPCVAKCSSASVFEWKSFPRQIKPFLPLISRYTVSWRTCDSLMRWRTSEIARATEGERYS